MNFIEPLTQRRTAHPTLLLSAAEQSRLRLIARRAALALATASTAAFATSHLIDVVMENGVSPIECAMVPLFVVLVLPIALSFWIATFGFVMRRFRTDELSITRDLAHSRSNAALFARTAIVIPVHNEDPVRVAAGIKATFDSLARTGQLHTFEFFICSDTTDPDLWVEEEASYARLKARLTQPARLTYVKRRRNTEHKAGNIAEFCARFGDRFRYMVVFDADSVMSGATLVDLVRMMERHPDAGIIQAPPVPVNRQTLFARLQQFSARVYGPVFQAGLAYVQGGEGNFYGHNAIIRIQPFKEHCRLPKLDGEGPLAGHILSHDFVEAAFMRRAGFKVYFAHDLGGSFEECPPTLVDFAARERRWCQGNMQHARLLRWPGLNFISRVHMAMGVMAFASAPLWLLLLVLSTVEGLREHWVGWSGAARESSIAGFADSPLRSGMLFALVLGMLFLPKLYGLTLHLTTPGRARRFGGAEQLGTSVLLESLFSVLLAPTMAYLHTRFVLGVLRGQVVQWTSQERDDVATPFSEAARRHAGTTALGIAWGALAWFATPSLFPWLLPFLIGLVLSIPLSWSTSRASAGRKARERGWFVTPEETDPPFVLRRLAAELLREQRAEPTESRRGLERLLLDDSLREAHFAALPSDEDAPDPLQEHARRGIELKARLRGLATLTPRERYELQTSRSAIAALSP
ncbi:MAG: glucans biosynthesis glucosyltransferase MdoH [Planctomycetes bacterium]|nr:glucans biosynthesis glucosyltransferase MdoH [Planctomycetota bacterium]MCC7172289.1 glucans biosynthesis glucosyltransferase MdoH [Planctomycetota bacterium]